MFERVCSGRTTTDRAPNAKPSQVPTMNRVSVHWVLGVKSPSQSRISAVATAKPPAASAKYSTEFSWTMRCLLGGFGRTRAEADSAALAIHELARPASSEAIFLQAAVERAAAQSQRFRGLADVATIARHGLLDQRRFHFF